jgi:chromatin segregation and condensation protein Rec8/ScpA/Scc1 (kleisin family)
LTGRQAPDSGYVLALLELAKLRAIKLMQVEEFGTIRIMKAVADGGSIA